MSATQHIEWLNLVEKTGPFLAVGALDEAFPQGLEKVETRKRQRVRSAYDEWRDAVDDADSQLDALHREWLRLVLEEVTRIRLCHSQTSQRAPRYAYLPRTSHRRGVEARFRCALWRQASPHCCVLCPGHRSLRANSLRDLGCVARRAYDHALSCPRGASRSCYGRRAMDAHKRSQGRQFEYRYLVCPHLAARARHLAGIRFATGCAPAASAQPRPASRHCFCSRWNIRMNLQTLLANRFAVRSKFWCRPSIALI